MWTLLYRAAWTVARAASPLLASGDGKLARGVRGRRDAALGIAAWARNRDTSRPLIWFHAASVGEGRQAEAVLVRLRRARPDCQIMFTHSSASAEAMARAIPADYAGYVPADSLTDTALALDAARPSALVFSATDLWPELVRQAHRRRVPLALISATLAPTSSRRGPLARSLLTKRTPPSTASARSTRAMRTGCARSAWPRIASSSPAIPGTIRLRRARAR